MPLETEMFGDARFDVVFTSTDGKPMQPRAFYDLGIYLRDEYPDEWAHIGWSKVCEPGFFVYREPVDDAYGGPTDDSAADIRLYNVAFDKTPWGRGTLNTFTSAAAIEFRDTVCGADPYADPTCFMVATFRRGATRRMVAQFAFALEVRGFVVLQTDGCILDMDDQVEIKWTKSTYKYYDAAGMRLIRTVLDGFPAKRDYVPRMPRAKKMRSA